ncbi:MAG: nucleoside permease [Candidatus Hydrogenedentes bacterium]|nr:nucleoside permease [Candidatus Hydrogenedentota bacterium]
MDPIIRIRLSIMMFLQFIVWGCWYVTMGTYLTSIGFQGTSVGFAYSSTAWGAILAPFLVGMVADRFFPAQIVLGVAHLIGAVLMFLVSRTTDQAPFFVLLLAYAITYMPTLALVNAISFHQMTSPEREFPSIRVLGTLGWIVAGLVIGWMGIEATSKPMAFAAACSVVLGLYSFTLPNTPPRSKGKSASFGEILGTDALTLLKDKSFAIFVIASLLVCIPLSFYYSFANLFLNESGVVNAAGKQTMGQMSEVFFLLVMPFFFKRLGVKMMLLVGMLAWVVRYVLFAYGNSESLVMMFYVGILLHGVCFDFFFVTGQIYVDKKAPAEVRASAQGFIALITYGVGMVIGTYFSGVIAEHYQIMDAAGAVVGHQWKYIWLIPAAMAFVVIVLFTILFTDKDVPVEDTANAKEA